MKTLADNLSAVEGISHGFFGARGGVSSDIYKTLNCGQGSNDDPVDVAKNRQIVAKDLSVDADHLISPYQVHSAKASDCRSVLACSVWSVPGWMRLSQKPPDWRLAS